MTATPLFTTLEEPVREASAEAWARPPRTTEANAWRPGVAAIPVAPCLTLTPDAEMEAADLRETAVEPNTSLACGVTVVREPRATSASMTPAALAVKVERPEIEARAEYVSTACMLVVDDGARDADAPLSTIPVAESRLPPDWRVAAPNCRLAPATTPEKDESVEVAGRPTEAEAESEGLARGVARPLPK